MLDRIDPGSARGATPGQARIDRMKKWAVTIVISTAERPGLVLDCVKSFKNQVPEHVELVVVDAGKKSPVDEEAMCRLWRNSRLIRSPVKNMAIQRNEGIRQGKGEIIIFLDDDCYVQPNWWPAIVEPFADPKVGAVAGAVWCNPNPKLTNVRGGYVNIFGVPVQVTHRGEGAPRDVDWTVGVNMAFRKNVATELGGLAGVYGIYDEDVDFGLRIKKAGWRIVFQPEAAVYHYFTKRPTTPATKFTEFRAGRNRSMLLVRNYGFSIRLFVFLLTAPWVQLYKVSGKVLRSTITSYGHAAAYVIGTLKGIVDGARNPVSRDKKRFEGESKRMESAGR